MDEQFIDGVLWLARVAETGNIPALVGAAWVDFVQYGYAAIGEVEYFSCHH